MSGILAVSASAIRFLGTVIVVAVVAVSTRRPRNIMAANGAMTILPGLTDMAK